MDVTNEETISINSEKAQELISNYNIKKLPTVLIFGEINKTKIFDFLILFLFSTQRPTELVIFRGTPYILFFIALILIIVSIFGLKKFLVTWRRTFRRIALFTLLPGILGIIVTISGESILTYLFKDIPLPIIESYLRSITPQLWILTVAYIVVSIFFYKFSQKFE